MIKKASEAVILEHYVEERTGINTSPPPGKRPPHPIPYQGSKRCLAPRILATLNGSTYQRLYEPFAGSAALTIAASIANVADEYVIGDILEPLIGIWQRIVTSPDSLVEAYEKLWCGQAGSDHTYYEKVREEFNATRSPESLLYLLARCVKNALRFNRQGAFNQAQDRRRRGMHPHKMRREIREASSLLAGRTRAICADFEEIITSATKNDLVYLDPPYQGTTTGADKRYYQGLPRTRLIAALADLNRRGVPFLLSYDGRCGNRTYGPDLPANLHLTRVELVAGRSSQATLHGRNELTIESLYISEYLAKRGIDQKPTEQFLSENGDLALCMNPIKIQPDYAQPAS